MGFFGVCVGFGGYQRFSLGHIIFIFIMAAKHTDGNIRQEVLHIISLESLGRVW